MKEVLTIELDRSELEDSLAEFLNERGYGMKKVDFVFRSTFDVIKITGAKVTVEKNGIPKNPVESVSVVRDEVQQFSKAMESQLRVNEHKGHWCDDSFDFLAKRIYKHIDALCNEYNKHNKDNLDKHEMTLQCANIANYAMMIADNYGEGI